MPCADHEPLRSIWLSRREDWLDANAFPLVVTRSLRYGAGVAAPPLRQCSATAR